MTFQYRMLADHPGLNALRRHVSHSGFACTLMQPQPATGSPFIPAAPAPGFVAPRPARRPAARGQVTGFYALTAKRALDVVVSLAMIVAALPVMILLALALWLESGNPFYSQPRLGRNGRVFRMFKLRTMVRGADALLARCLAADPALNAEWQRSQKLKNDPRITGLGRLVRMTSMDELPQLFNVLRGDMSLVGPRPMLPDQLPLYLHPDAYLALRPGLSGLWQVTARNDKDFDTRAILDRRYARRLSFWLDLRILLATLRAVFRGTGY